MTEERFKQCPNCDNWIPDNATVCMYCDAKLAPVKSASRLKQIGLGVVAFLVLCTGASAIGALFDDAPTEEIEAAPTWTSTSEPPPGITPLSVDAPAEEPADSQQAPTDTPTAVPVVAATNTPIPVQQTGPTANNVANLRSGPSTDYDVVGQAQQGQALTLVARNQAGDWYRTAAGAWIFASLVDRAPDDLEVAESASLPTATAASIQVAATATPVSSQSESCHPSYPNVCIAPPPPDLNCPGIPYKNIVVAGSDPHGLDGNKDGIACEE